MEESKDALENYKPENFSMGTIYAPLVVTKSNIQDVVENVVKVILNEHITPETK